MAQGFTGSQVGITVKEADGDPSVTSVKTIVVTNGKLTDDGNNQVTLDIAGAALTVKEIDGAPNVTDITTIQFTNGRLTDNGSGDVTVDLVDPTTAVNTADIRKAEQNIVLNTFRTQINGSLTLQNMVDGFTDEYEDETGIAQLVQIAQGDGTVIANNFDVFFGGSAAAFDGNTNQSTAQGAGAADVPQTADDRYVGKNWGEGVTHSVTKMIVYGANDSFGLSSNSVSTTSVLLQHSPDGVTWTTAGSITGLTPTASGIHTIIATDTTARQYHRCAVFHVGEVEGFQSQIAEIEFFEGEDLSTNITYDASGDFYDSSAGDMVLISVAQTAETQPDVARVVILEEDVDSVTLNTDLKCFASRDGGTTFTEITLINEGSFDSSKNILAASIDISAQPAGTSMVYKITTLNSKELKIHATGLLWD